MGLKGGFGYNIYKEKVGDHEHNSKTFKVGRFFKN